MKPLFTLLVLALPLGSTAQTAPQQAAAAASPAAAVPALPYQPLPPTGASGLVQERADWKAVNATVGQYPRGHQDIVKWERAQASPAAPQEPTQ